MDKQLGKWQLVKEESKGMEEFLKKMGYQDKDIEGYKNIDYTLELSKDGDTYTTVASIVGRDPQTYKFKLGETIDYNALDGTKPKLTITEEGEESVESYNLEESNRKWKTTRKVEGDKMTATSTIDGVTMVQVLKKI